MGIRGIPLKAKALSTRKKLMDAIALIGCFVFMIMLISAYENAYENKKKIMLVLIVGTILLPVILFALSVMKKTTVVEKFYSVDSFSGFSFHQPADIEVTTTTYPKWSCLSTDTTFKQLPKGK